MAAITVNKPCPAVPAQAGFDPQISRLRSRAESNETLVFSVRQERLPKSYPEDEESSFPVCINTK